MPNATGTPRPTFSRRARLRSHRLRVLTVSSVIAGASMLVAALAGPAASATQLPSPELSDSVPAEGRVEYDDRVTEITVSPLEAFPGGTVHVTGICTLWGFAATDVLITFVSSENMLTSAYVPVDSDTGLIDADVIVPADLQPGPHTLGWMCAADDMAFGAHDERIPFMVLGSVPTDPPATAPAGSAGSGGAPEHPASKDAVAGTLAETGFPSPAAGLVTFGILAAVGTAVVVVARRRSRALDDA